MLMLGEPLFISVYPPLYQKGYDFLEKLRSYPTTDSPRRRRAKRKSQVWATDLAQPGVAITTPANHLLGGTNRQETVKKKNIRKSLWLQGIYKNSALCQMGFKGIDIHSTVY